MSLQAHLASYFVGGQRVVYSIDRTGIDKVWITVRTEYAQEYKDYLDALFLELHKWTLEEAHAITECWRRPCWSTDIHTLTGAEQEYFSREHLAESSQFPPLPIARLARSSWAQKTKATTSPLSITNQNQSQEKKLKAATQAQPINNTPNVPPQQEPQSNAATHDVIKMIKFISAEVHNVKQDQKALANATTLRFQKLHSKVEAYEANSMGRHKQIQEQVTAETTLTATDLSTIIEQNNREIDDRLTIKMQVLEDSVLSISNRSESTDKDTTALAGQLQRALEEFGRYTTTSTLTLQVLEQNLATHRIDTANILQTLTNKLQTIPPSDNIRSFERQMTDLDLAQNRLTNQMIQQHDNFKTALAQSSTTQYQQNTIMDRLNYLESQNEGLQKTLSKVQRLPSRTNKVKTTSSRTAIAAYRDGYKQSKHNHDIKTDTELVHQQRAEQYQPIANLHHH